MQPAGSDPFIAQSHPRLIQRCPQQPQVHRQTLDVGIAVHEDGAQFVIGFRQHAVAYQQRVALLVDGGQLDHKLVDDPGALFELGNSSVATETR